MLYIVATPIGNLGDMSARAIEVLKSVDLIASEDTRHTGMLLKRFDISTQQMALHEHNERQAMGRVLSMLRAGQNVALVSDAGTPGISDPGFPLIRACADENLPVTMVPGPAAFVMALVLSALPSHSFTYRGFPPRTQIKRQKFLAVDLEAEHTLIFYEAPSRIKELIEDAIAIYGDRRAAIGNDLTKLFETIVRGKLSELLMHALVLEPKGEYVLVIEGNLSA